MHPPHRHERENDGDRQRHDRHERRTHMPEEHDADQGDDDAFLNEFLAQCRDGAFDQIAAIVGRHDAHASWERGFDLLDFPFYTVDNVERVFAVTHDNNAADGLAFAIQLRDAAPDVAAKMDAADVLHVNRRAVLDFEDNVLDVLDFFDVTAAADEILGRCDFQNAAAHIGVAHFDGVDDLAERNVVSNERVWIEIDLVLLHESADRGDFRNAFHGRERVTQIPILNRAQLREIVFPAVVNQRVFINPSNAGRVRTDYRIHALG